MGPDTQDLAAQSQAEIQAFTQQVLRRFRQALPDPGDRALFTRLMGEARAAGLNWTDSLEYVAQQRSSRCR